jgi:hypothetical protein
MTFSLVAQASACEDFFVNLAQRIEQNAPTTITPRRLK